MQKAILTLSLVAAPLFAQQPSAIKVEKDPTMRVQSVPLPAGWTVRLDDKDMTRFTVNDTRFVSMGSGYHVTSGPAAIYYNPANQVTGAFTATARFRQTRAPMHPEAYGLFIGGRDLATPQQQYMYFLVRGDGKFYVAHRAGPDVHTVVPWTDNAAIVRQDSAGVATNTLTIQATADSVYLVVNGTRVQSFGHPFQTDGQVGLRVNHNLDVHIDAFEVKRN
jgi:hypothetical protein